MNVELGTTSHPSVPRGMYEECLSEYLRDVSQKIKSFSVLPELVLNAPSLYGSVGKQTMAVKSSKSIPIADLSDKRKITLTFVLSLAGEFLPMQDNSFRKKQKSHPRGFVFPKGFAVTQNPNTGLTSRRHSN